MYLPAHFRSEDAELTAKLIDAHPFATLVSSLDGAPFASHLPLLRAGPDRLIGHVARANPHWQAFGAGRTALAIFHGPHAFISPRMYASAPNVPTWNYAAVHASGEIHVLEGPSAIEVLSALTTRFESPRANPWSMDEMSPEYLKRLLKALVAFELRVTRWEVKLKLSQNKSADDQERMHRELEASADPEARALAALGRSLPPKRAG